MPSPTEEAQSRYIASRPVFVAAGKDVKALLEQAAAGAGIVASVTTRTKDPGEFARKVIRKEYKDDPWHQVTDKLGARVTVERLSHVDAFLEVVKDHPELQVVEVQDLREGADPKEFDYRGVHVQLALARTLDDGEVVECELQIRTRAQDLWSATVSHRLLYKPVVALPWELQRPLYRLLALVEVFDEEFDRAMKGAAGLSGYRDGAFVELAEREYLRHSPRLAGDPKLTAEILPVLIASIDADPEVYAAQLEQFMHSHDEGFRAVLQDYGPESGAEDFAYLLFGQPEIVILYERLATAPSRVVEKWTEAGLPDSLLDSTASVLGVPI